MSAVVKKWARQLRDAALAREEIPSHLLVAFTEHYLQMAEHSDRITLAISDFATQRAVAHETSARWQSSEAATALRALAQDVASGLHVGAEPPVRRTYMHADGGTYELLGTCEVKNDDTGDWDEAVAYRSLGMRREVLYVTTIQRWDDRFEPVTDPDQ